MPTPSLKETQAELNRVKKTLATTIIWITQSAGSPLSIRNAEDLLKMLELRSPDLTEE